LAFRPCGPRMQLRGEKSANTATRRRIKDFLAAATAVTEG
jgi:hypothetical protein